MEWRAGKTFKHTSLWLVLTALFFGLLYRQYDFNWIQGFLKSSAIENRNGVYFLAIPINYITTRLEDISEIILFMGPFVAALVWRGLKNPAARKGQLMPVSLAAIAALSAMFLAGVCHTGETARICIFIYPFLMIPLAVSMEPYSKSIAPYYVLWALVFGQTLSMQLVADYFW